jgi:hypothetical protein
MPRVELSADRDGRLFLKEDVRDSLRHEGDAPMKYVGIATFGGLFLWPAGDSLTDAMKRLDAIRSEVEERLKVEDNNGHGAVTG